MRKIAVFGVMILSIVHFYSCQKQIAGDFLRPLDSTITTNKHALYGWHLTETFFGSVIESHITFTIDSAQKRILYFDSLLNLPAYRVQFNNDWKLISIRTYDTLGKFVTDSFARNSAGKLTAYISMGDNNTVLYYNSSITENVFPDSVQYIMTPVYPAPGPGSTSSRGTTMSRPDQKEVGYFFTSKDSLPNSVSYGKIQYNFLYDAQGLLTKTTGYSGSLYVSPFPGTAHTTDVRDHTWQTTGKFDQLQQLEKMIYGDDMGWYRGNAPVVPDIESAMGWVNLSKVPAAITGVQKEYVNNVLGQTTALNINFQYTVDANGNLATMDVHIQTQSQPDFRYKYTFLYR